jgi:HAD superfamily hydrolase (TIGR01549 family)
MPQRSLSNGIESEPGIAASCPLTHEALAAYIRAMVLRAVLFDYGGTLDGGTHWLDRFLGLYHEAGLLVSFDCFREAFDHATRCAYADRSVGELDLQPLIAFHVARHMERLGVRDAGLAERVTTAFVAASRAGLAESRVILEHLRRRVALGVVSNFYGNVGRLLEEANIAPLLASIIDSTRVGVSKPDPEIFALAVRQIGCDPGNTLYVGDSFEKDVVGAHAAGLRTAWLVGIGERPCPAPELVDVRLRRLADLEEVVQ